MGNKQNKFLKDPEIKKQLDKFDKLELIILHKIFLDLSSRDYEVLNKETFLRFFPLTGLWGERFFEKFDTRRTGHLKFPEFVKGIRRCCKSSDEEKIQFLFELYDTNNDGFIEKKDMITMFYNIPKQYLNFISDELPPVRKIGNLADLPRKSLTHLVEEAEK